MTSKGAPVPPVQHADEFEPEKEVIYENTYITKPEGFGPVRKFARMRN